MENSHLEIKNHLDDTVQSRWFDVGRGLRSYYLLRITFGTYVLLGIFVLLIVQQHL